MRAITVCVDYADVLALTLPYNRHHFKAVHVVTSPADKSTQYLASYLGVGCLVTDAFYRDRAHFAKWAALEEGLDAMGREGELCILDADVLLPKAARLAGERGTLSTPLRRMCPTFTVPPESEWRTYPLHRNVGEWAGYCQVFHAADPALGPPPWHDVTWTHCGGADSFFQAKWPRERRVRPPFECLHLGPCGTHWFGRANPRGAELTAKLWADRKRARGTADPYPGERRGPPA